jgi:hypothetical protein
MDGNMVEGLINVTEVVFASKIRGVLQIFARPIFCFVLPKAR